MNSEVWVCMTEQKRCLPFQLVEHGYDVWLGNNRGNKYSKKSSRFSPALNDFWDFSIDQFAFHDIPNSIDYILATTHQRSLSYIGFSQGTAQAFAALSTHPSLNDKVDVLIALAPAMSPAGLQNGVVDSLVKASPEVLFLAFGRRSLLSSTTMWQSILYPPIFVRILDMSLSFLFKWSCRNITLYQKLAAYPHLYSFTSTKSVVHWFQIIRNKSFQMYDDDVQAPMSVAASDRYYKVAKFPTRNIKTPIVLIYGGSDSLVDIRVMMKQLPRHTVATEISHFEHLDFLWAQGVENLVFPIVFKALTAYAGRDHLKSLAPPYKTLGKAQLAAVADPSYSEDDNSSRDYSVANSATGDSNAHELDLPAHKSSPITRWRKQLLRTQFSPSKEPSTESGEDVAEPPEYIGPYTKTSAKHTHKRSGSTSSLRSFEGAPKFGEDGISVGASRATTSIVKADLPSAHARKPSAAKQHNTP
ncbi:MAG: hypothetical protein Q9217_003268 [Psora testacea]